MQESKISLSGFIHTQAQGNIQEMMIYVYQFWKIIQEAISYGPLSFKNNILNVSYKVGNQNWGRLNQQENMSAPFLMPVSCVSNTSMTTFVKT